MKKHAPNTISLAFCFWILTAALLAPLAVAQDRDFEEADSDTVFVDPVFPVLRQVSLGSSSPGLRMLAFSANDRPDDFIAAFERRFGEPGAGDAGAQWLNLNYEPWGIGDVAVTINVKKDQAHGAREAFEVLIQVSIPSGGEAEQDSLDTIQEWFQRLVNATSMTAIRTSEM